MNRTTGVTPSPNQQSQQFKPQNKVKLFGSGKEVEVITEAITPKQRTVNLIKALFATIPTFGLALLSKTVRNLWKSSYTGFEERKVRQIQNTANEDESVAIKTKAAFQTTVSSQPSDDDDDFPLNYTNEKPHNQNNPQTNTRKSVKKNDNDNFDLPLEYTDEQD